MHIRLIRTDDCLRLTKSPGTTTSALFFGILSLGIGAAYYGCENIFLKIGYIIGCLIIALSVLEEWESCLIDKKSQTVTLSRTNVYQKFLPYSRSTDLKFPIHRVMSVRINSSKPSDGSSTIHRQITLLLTSSISLPIFRSDNSDLSKIECDRLAETLRAFLNLNHLETVDFDDLDQSYYYSDRDDGNSSDDSQFQVPIANDGRPREIVTLIGAEI